MPPVTQTGPCSQLSLAVILAPRARPRHNGFVVHAWLHRAWCRAVRTARSRRAIVPSTHLAREGRMTVTIGRRELLGRTRRRGDYVAARGTRAAAWSIAAPRRAHRSKRTRFSIAGSTTSTGRIE